MQADQGETPRNGSIQAAFQSPTFGKDGSFHVNEAVGSASISPSGRDVVLASREGLHIIDLDKPFSPPRHLSHRTPWEVADVQWSPFASRDYWVVSTSNQKALVWNLDMKTSQAPIQHVLHAHSRAISDINFSAHDPDKLATCAIDSFVHCWDFRQPARPVISFADWFAGATQVKWNRQDSHVIASSHDRYLHIWDERKAVVPLKTINAHSTKIYGIDWSRTESSNILTCSLDKTIKFWDYSQPGDIPTEVIKTDYPVWRARHTPFGSGVLAMPQRGNNDLHLYYLHQSFKAEVDAGGAAVAALPVHTFTGHGDQVKEFLWRTQGCVEDDVDNRSFQLVSWSTDRNLLLHGLDQSIYQKVAFTQGGTADRRLTFTRQGAVYRSFHDESSVKPQKVAGHGLSTLFRDKSSQGMRKAPIPLTGWDGREFISTSVNGMRVRSVAMNKETNPIEWMKGVKIGDPLTSGGASHLRSELPWEKSETLGDEIIVAGETHRNVNFDKVDVSSRFIVLSLSGPWGVDDASAYLKATVYFPAEYPNKAPADVKVERTSNISDASFTRISVEIKVICEAYKAIGRGSILAILRYLLGEDHLQGSLARVNDHEPLRRRSIDSQTEDSSSDEEDIVVGPDINPIPSLDMEGSGGDLLGIASANANVPLPKACGALWADDGTLVCFFPPKKENAARFQLFDHNNGERRPRSTNLFESFGRLPHTGSTASDLDTEAGSDSSSLSSTTFSFSSGGTEIDEFSFLGKPTWPKTSKPLVEASADRDADPNSSSSQHKALEAKQFISLHDFSAMLPSKRILAEEYQIHGDAHEVCEHNAEVAHTHGYNYLADIWSLLELVLCDKVPLEMLKESDNGLDLFVLARRALVHIKKRDSGLDLAFDEPDNVLNAKIRGRVKWGNHPLAGFWMINKIFEYFEHVGDVQMLAMLSCILCETEKYRIRTNKGHTSNGLIKFSPQYFASPAAALNFWARKSPSSTQIRLTAPTSATYGSFPSSTGVWSSDENESEKKTVTSNASSPLVMSRQGSRISHLDQSLSSSPERTMQRSNSTASNAFAASFSRQFASFLASASSSPPNQARTPELSTSAPSSGVTWGRNIIHRDGTNHGKFESLHSPAYEFDHSSAIGEEGEESESDEETTIILKNQHMIDDEACLDIPLLNPDHEERYRAYREAYAHLLYIWRMPVARSEILKFNFYWSNHTLEGSDLAPDEMPSKKDAEYLYGLRMVPACLNCGEEGTASLYPQNKCEKCNASRAGLPCSFCGESVHGLYKSCLICGHVTHLGCMVSEHLDDELDRKDECSIGCGCFCDGVLEDTEDSHQVMSNADLRAHIKEDSRVKEWSRKLAVFD